MKCPVCGDPDLLLSERQGVEIDYCPKCLGVWLDRGELDKLIDRAAAHDPSLGAAAERGGVRDDYRGRDDYRDRPEQRFGDDYHQGKHHRKRRGFLGDFFDFD